jgi:guanine deaminase
MENRDFQKKFMDRAIALALHALEQKHGNPFGSVVVKDGNIVGEGWNQVRSTHDPSAHAEMLAIRDAAQRLGTPRLEGCIVYASGQPCPMCLSLIYLSGIQKVFYCISGEEMAQLNPALSVEHIYSALALPQGERPIEEIQAMREEIVPTIRRYRELME